MSSRTAWSTDGVLGQPKKHREPVSKSQKLKTEIKEIEFKKSRIKMENTQSVWILYVIMLSLNCLNAEKKATAAKRYLLINAKLIQDMYFKNTLISKLKSKVMLLWRRGFDFVSTGNERLWIHSELRKIRFN